MVSVIHCLWTLLLCWGLRLEWYGCDWTPRLVSSLATSSVSFCDKQYTIPSTICIITISYHLWLNQTISDPLWLIQNTKFIQSDYYLLWLNQWPLVILMIDWDHLFKKIWLLRLIIISDYQWSFMIDSETTNYQFWLYEITSDPLWLIEITTLKTSTMHVLDNCFGNITPVIS